MSKEAKQGDVLGCESGLTEYVLELSGECPSFREGGWVHGL